MPYFYKLNLSTLIIDVSKDWAAKDVTDLGNLVPGTDNAKTLGSATGPITWATIFLGSANQIRSASTIRFAVIAGGTDQAIQCAGITASGSLAFGANTVACGAITSSGTLQLTANTINSGSHTPNADYTMSLGSATLGWGHLYLGLATSAKIHGGITIAFRDMADGADQAITCGALGTSGAINASSASIFCSSGYVGHQAIALYNSASNDASNWQLTFCGYGGNNDCWKSGIKTLNANATGPSNTIDFYIYNSALDTQYAFPTRKCFSFNGDGLLNLAVAGSSNVTGLRFSDSTTNIYRVGVAQIATDSALYFAVNNLPAAGNQTGAGYIGMDTNSGSLFTMIGGESAGVTRTFTIYGQNSNNVILKCVATNGVVANNWIDVVGGFRIWESTYSNYATATYSAAGLYTIYGSLKNGGAGNMVTISAAGLLTVLGTSHGFACDGSVGTTWSGSILVSGVAKTFTFVGGLLISVV